MNETKTLEEVKEILADLYDDLLEKQEVRTKRTAWVWVQINKRLETAYKKQ